MGASSSTFDHDFEMSVAKLFENNVHTTTGAAASRPSPNVNIHETSYRWEPNQYQTHTVVVNPPEYVTANAVRIPDELELNSDDYINSDDSPVIELNKESYINYSENLAADKYETNYTNLEENGKRDLRKEYLPLYKAALNGDWRRARDFLNVDPDAVTARITIFSETALHIAARAGHSTFVEKMVQIMTPESLELKDDDGSTALHVVACAGITRAAKALVKKNPNLTQITDNMNWVPLVVAAYFASPDQKKMVKYLCSVTTNEDPKPYSGVFGGNLIGITTTSYLYDIALYLIQKYPNLATQKREGHYSSLEVMARRPSSFPSGSKLRSWQRFIYPYIPVDNYSKRSGELLNRGEGLITKFLSMTYLSQLVGIKQVYEQKLIHKQAMALVERVCGEISRMSSESIINFFNETGVLLAATRYGVAEVVLECIKICPDLIWLRMDKTNENKENKTRRTILEEAIEFRQEKIFNLIRVLNGPQMKVPSLDGGNTILHLAAKLAPTRQLNSVSGAALQMQRELQWFKEVENLTLERHKKRIVEGKTAEELFTEKHADLMKKGEEWMKKTAEQCSLVSTLIITVVFASAFTVPGGSVSDTDNPNNGNPIFLSKTPFMVFVISDALALFSSITSVIIFLSMLTSRYAEEDFLESLPQKMIIGLATLFFSIATTVVAFSAAITILLEDKYSWIPIPLVLIAVFPVTLFALLQLPLFKEIFRSTCKPKIFGRKNQHVWWK